MEEQIKILCVKLGISIAELARRNGMSPQAFGKRLKRNSFSPDELKSIAEAVGCEYRTSFILPNGETVDY